MKEEKSELKTNQEFNPYDFYQKILQGLIAPISISIKNTSNSEIKNVKLFNDSPNENKDIQYKSNSFSDQYEGYSMITKIINSYNPEGGIKIGATHIISLNNDAPFETLLFNDIGISGETCLAPVKPSIDPDKDVLLIAKYKQKTLAINKYRFELNVSRNIYISKIPANTEVEYLFYPTEM